MAQQISKTPAHLVYLGRAALGLPRQQFAHLISSSVRTIERWSAGRSIPMPFHLELLARHVHPRDPALAAELAAAAGKTLEALGIGVPAPTPVAAPVSRPLVDSVVCAAAEAMDVSPRAIRGAVAAAFARAKELGLDVAAVDSALAAPPAKQRAK